ncbi:MAG: galactose mutarotase [Clostridiales bacterium]|nr:galactose mutarotase [Clostridiales bacterium]
MSVNVSVFGKTADGKTVEEYTIINKNGTKVSVITYGATLKNIFVRDKNNKLDDILVGFDDMDGFINRSDYQGVIVGPYANRIGGASFSVDGKKYKLTANEKGVTCLHSAGEFNTAVWNGAATSDNSVKLTYRSPDRLNGFPGNIDACVTYILTDDDELKLEYKAVSDKKTVINLTNHAYFNLGGFDSGSVLDHIVSVNADYITPVDEYSIPTGELAAVENTPFDFKKCKRIGDEIDFDCEQLNFTGGYDHNFCINGYNGKLKAAASVFDPRSGRKMDVYTDLPGIQFYTGNFLKGDLGKDNKPIEKRSGFCLETQFFPDTPNKPNFIQCTFAPGQEYTSETVFKFYTAK